MTEKYGVGLWAFGALSDRFSTTGYKPRFSLEQQIRLAAQAKGVRGVELHYPSDFTEDQIDLVRGLVHGANLEVSTICVNFFSDPKWQYGSITSRDSTIRNKALEMAKTGIDIAERMGVGNFSIWFGQDGHDYLFNDYEEKWNLMIEGISEIARHDEKTTIFLEYKQKEPRTHLQIANVAKVLSIIHETDLKNIGVLIDVGHALMADENVAESVALVHRRGAAFQMHFNDNCGYWDDDMIVGAINFWKYVELFYQLEKVRYDGWYDLDIFPYREYPVRAVEQSISFIDYLKKRVRENYERIDAAVKEGDVHRTIDTLRKLFLKGYE